VQRNCENPQIDEICLFIGDGTAPAYSHPKLRPLAAPRRGQRDCVSFRWCGPLYRAAQSRTSAPPRLAIPASASDQQADPILFRDCASRLNEKRRAPLRADILANGGPLSQVGKTGGQGD